MKLFFFKIGYKILILILLLGVMMVIYSKWFYSTDIEAYSDVFKQIAPAAQKKIIYLGESSNFTWSKKDKSHSPISNLISDYFPELGIGTIDHSAYHANQYLHILENLPDSNNVETVIVTLNLRSFSAQWIYSELETPIQKQMVLLRKYPPLINRFLLSLKDYEIKTKLERNNQFLNQWKEQKYQLPFDFPYSNLTSWDRGFIYEGPLLNDNNNSMTLNQLGTHYIKAYGFQLWAYSNPRIDDFDAIVALCKKNNYRLLLNLMAENVDKVKLLVGDNLYWFLDKNRKYLIDRYSKQGVLVVDNLDDVRDIDFIDQNWTTEHYTLKGRQIIAKNVADSLKKYYPDYYKDINTYSDEKNRMAQTIYENDCESDTVWGPSYTFTYEKAFSGLRSSIISPQYKFSTTCVVKNIPASDSVIVSANVAPGDSGSIFNCVMEMNGNFVPSMWYNSSDTLIIGQNWKKYKHVFNFHKPFVNNADELKFYFYQIAGKTYIDDIIISFK